MGVNSYYLYELACYATPSEKLVYALEPNIDLAILLFTDYRKFQTWKRKLFVEKVGSEFIQECLASAKASNLHSPIESLIESVGVSNIAFCKILSINPGHISKLLSGKLRRLPTQIENALVEIGLEFSDIDEINERLKEFISV